MFEEVGIYEIGTYMSMYETRKDSPDRGISSICFYYPGDDVGFLAGYSSASFRRCWENYTYDITDDEERACQIDDQ